MVAVEDALVVFDVGEAPEGFLYVPVEAAVD